MYGHYLFLAPFCNRNFTEIKVNKPVCNRILLLSPECLKNLIKPRIFKQKMNVGTSWLIIKFKNITILLLLLLWLIDFPCTAAAVAATLVIANRKEATVLMVMDARYSGVSYYVFSMSSNDNGWYRIFGPDSEFGRAAVNTEQQLCSASFIKCSIQITNFQWKWTKLHTNDAETLYFCTWRWINVERPPLFFRCHSGCYR